VEPPFNEDYGITNGIFQPSNSKKRGKLIFIGVREGHRRQTNKQTNKQTKNTLFYSSSIDSFAASQLQFASRYRGKTVTVLPGFSVNFTWSFSSGSDNGVSLVMWGVKRDGDNFFTSNGLLVSLHPLRSPVSLPNARNKEYSGRVGGSLTGNTSSGQAIFTLSSIRKSDERFYSCILFPHRGYKKDYDNLYLLVAGRQQSIHLNSDIYIF